MSPGIRDAVRRTSRRLMRSTLTDRSTCRSETPPTPAERPRQPRHPTRSRPANQSPRMRCCPCVTRQGQRVVSARSSLRSQCGSSCLLGSVEPKDRKHLDEAALLAEADALRVPNRVTRQRPSPPKALRRPRFRSGQCTRGDSASTCARTLHRSRAHVTGRVVSFAPAHRRILCHVSDSPGRHGIALTRRQSTSSWSGFSTSV